jgi:hypothetical protein
MGDEGGRRGKRYRTPTKLPLGGTSPSPRGQGRRARESWRLGGGGSREAPGERWWGSGGSCANLASLFWLKHTAGERGTQGSTTDWCWAVCAPRGLKAGANRSVHARTRANNPKGIGMTSRMGPRGIAGEGARCRAPKMGEGCGWFGGKRRGCSISDARGCSRDEGSVRANVRNEEVRRVGGARGRRGRRGLEARR